LATLDDINSTLQLIARNIGSQVQLQSNSSPSASTTTSPVSYPVNNVGTAAVSVIAANQTRFGLVFHNPGIANVYVFPSAMTVAPTTSSVGGSFIIYPGSTLSFPSTLFSNVNGAWSAFSDGGSNQPFTVLEFL
jgi:hypothetical protein